MWSVQELPRILHTPAVAALSFNLHTRHIVPHDNEHSRCRSYDPYYDEAIITCEFDSCEALLLLLSQL
jgi:hypothetical protein